MIYLSVPGRVFFMRKKKTLPEIGIDRDYTKERISILIFGKMGGAEMFKFFSKGQNDGNIIKSPVNGKCIDLSEVKDTVFSEKMMGDGVAFIFEGDTIYSPCQGTVATIAKSSHAIAITNSDDLEVLIHVGMNTVSLKGQGFDVLVEVNQKVKLGTPLIKIDRNLMQERSVDLTTPMIVTNTADFKLDLMNINQSVEKGVSEVIKYEKK